MSEPPSQLPLIPSQLQNSILGLRGLIGFMVGLFLFVFGPVVYRSFEAVQATHENADVPEPLFGISPLQWTVLLYVLSFVFDILLDIPTGLIADLCRRKTALVLSIFFRMLCFLSMLTFVSIPPGWGLKLLIAATALYIGCCTSSYFTFQNGAYEAWVNDYLHKEKGNTDSLSAAACSRRCCL